MSDVELLAFPDPYDHSNPREPTVEELVAALADRLPAEEIARACVRKLFDLDEVRTLREILVESVGEVVSDE